MQAFYRKRIPRCYAQVRMLEAVLTVCSVGSATLAYLESLTPFVALTSAVAAAISSWMAHDDLSRRIERYTNATMSIDNIVTWWNSLDDVERASTANIATLVDRGEEVITAERNAWLAAAREQDAHKRVLQTESAESNMSAMNAGPNALTSAVTALSRAAESDRNGSIPGSAKLD